MMAKKTNKMSHYHENFSKWRRLVLQDEKKDKQRRIAA
jgi:hypothetical protein